LSTAIILGYGGSLVASGEMSIGTFTAFFSYVAMVLWPVRQAGQMVTLWQQGASGAARLFEILDHVPEIADQGSAEVPEAINGDIALRGLRYRYKGAATDVLAGIDLDIARGETIAVLGKVGSGKTTLLRCLDAVARSAAGDAADRRVRRAFVLARAAAASGHWYRRIRFVPPICCGTT
jgi:ATP-binding cassette subfamily B protein